MPTMISCIRDELERLSDEQAERELYEEIAEEVQRQEASSKKNTEMNELFGDHYEWVQGDDDEDITDCVEMEEV